VGESVSYNDEDLMFEIKAGNMKAFDQLYERYCKNLLGFSFSITKSREEAENIVQDVFLNLWQNREKIEKGTSVKYYIFTIAHNSTISAIRKKRKDERFLEQLRNIQDFSSSPEELEAEYNDLDNELKKIIAELPDRQREIFLLHKVDGLKYQEIAEKLDISVNTIETHMSRALKAIRSKLGNYTFSAILFCYLFVR